MLKWVDFGRNWHEFTEQGLNKPGTIIQVNNHYENKIYTLFIGDINKECGTCNCCSELVGSEIIIKYTDTIREHFESCQ